MLICRRGHVTKPDIGAIRINENETRFEIANHMAEKFATAMVIADKDDVAISKLEGAVPAPAPRSERKRSFERGEGTEKYEDKKPHGFDAKPGYEGKKSFAGKPKFKGKFKPKGGDFKAHKGPKDKAH
jgi:ATP-dependent RNA helicase DeaD